MSCATPSRFSVASKGRPVGWLQVPHPRRKARPASRSQSRGLLGRYSQASPTWFLPTAVPAWAVADDVSETRTLGGRLPQPPSAISASPATSLDICLLRTVILHVLIVSPSSRAQNRSSLPTLSRLTVGSVNCCCCDRMLTLLSSAGFAGTIAGSTVQVTEPMAQLLKRYSFSLRPLLPTSWAAVGPLTLSTVPVSCAEPCSPNTARLRALIDPLMWPLLAASSTDGALILVRSMLPLAPPGWKLATIDAPLAGFTACGKVAPVAASTTSGVGDRKVAAPVCVMPVEPISTPAVAPKVLVPSVTMPVDWMARRPALLRNRPLMVSVWLSLMTIST